MGRIDPTVVPVVLFGENSETPTMKLMRPKAWLAVVGR